MPKMRAIQISKPGGPFEMVEREIPEPLSHEVLIKVEACGVCHGKAVVKEGLFPRLSPPRIPGHEVMSVIHSLGANIRQLKLGQRVAVGWHGGHCFACAACRKGDFGGCEKSISTGITRDGGYAEYMMAKEEAIIEVPRELNSIQSAPLVCAGRTIFGALKDCGALAGDLVAIHGFGGLGHLALQYAVHMGFKTLVISRGKSEESLAYQLGAHYFLDTTRVDPVKELNKLGGAKAIIGLAPNSQVLSTLVAGLARHGQLMVVTATHEPLQIPPNFLLGGGRSVRGFAGGDIAETMEFSLQSKIVPLVEIFPLEKAAEAYEKMMNAEVHFRAVLRMDESTH